MIRRKTTLVRRRLDIEIIYNFHSCIIVIIVDRKGENKEGNKYLLTLLGIQEDIKTRQDLKWRSYFKSLIVLFIKIFYIWFVSTMCTHRAIVVDLGCAKRIRCGSCLWGAPSVGRKVDWVIISLTWRATGVQIPTKGIDHQTVMPLSQ